MIRRPPRSTQSRSSAASDVYKRQVTSDVSLRLLERNDDGDAILEFSRDPYTSEEFRAIARVQIPPYIKQLSLIHISEPTRLGMISYAVFCLKKKKKKNK